MSLHQIYLARSQNLLVSRRTHQLLEHHGKVGCSPILELHPVCLEPKHTSIEQALHQENIIHAVSMEQIPKKHDCVRYQIHIAKDAEIDWLRIENFFKQIVRIQHRVTFEIIGNSEGVEMTILCQHIDSFLIENSFLGALGPSHLGLDSR